MADDEKLKDTEVSFQNQEGFESVNQSLLSDHVDQIFKEEQKMLVSIDAYISLTTKNSIVERIESQRNILLGISRKELKIREKISNEAKPVIDDKYFDKRSLNINNI